MHPLWGRLFFLLIVRPIVFVIIGLNRRTMTPLPAKGPAILVANHNSHLDTLVLMSLFPLTLLPRVRPVAAADYFLRNRLLAWFALRIIGIIPLSRTGFRRGDPLEAPERALKEGDILLIYPEGSRGEPEILQPFKSGIARIAERLPEVPVYPIFLQGLGKALPKGDFLLVPFFCDVWIENPIRWMGDRDIFLRDLETAIRHGAESIGSPPWL